MATRAAVREVSRLYCWSLGIGFDIGEQFLSSHLQLLLSVSFFVLNLLLCRVQLKDREAQHVALHYLCHAHKL